MKCDQCGSPNIAAQVMVETENGLEEKHLCRSCFDKYVAENPDIKDKGIEIDLSKIANMLMSSIAKPLSEMIKNNSKIPSVAKGSKTLKKSIENRVCPNCKTTEQDFRVKGQLGCQDCYLIFKPMIDKKLLDLCGESSESLTYSKSISTEQKVELLTLELSEAIEAEEFEVAAKIRDDLKYYNNK